MSLKMLVLQHSIFQGKPILSTPCLFEIHKTDQPWVAYRQFVNIFGPTGLMSYLDPRLLRLNQLLLTEYR